MPRRSGAALLAIATGTGLGLDASTIEFRDQSPHGAKLQILGEDGAHRLRLLGHHDELLIDAAIAERHGSADREALAQLRVFLARRWTSSNKPLPGPTYHRPSASRIMDGRAPPTYSPNLERSTVPSASDAERPCRMHGGTSPGAPKGNTAKIDS